jgi:hypothetical protein
MRRPTLRFWLEAGLAASSAAVFLLTLVVPEWIEVVFRVDPDGGNGSLEWLIAAACALATVGWGFLARRELRRPALSAAAMR